MTTQTRPPSPSGTMRIVPATPAHATVLAALHAACFAEQPWHRPWDLGAMESLLTLPGAQGWLAVVGDHGDDGGIGTPAGLLLIQAVAEDADILTLGVLPGPWRRLGIARQLLTHVMESMRADGGQRLILEVAEDNSGAIAFYQANGFARIGLRRGYFTGEPGHPRDALVMARAVT